MKKTIAVLIVLLTALLPFADVLAGSVSNKDVFEEANLLFDMANVDLRRAIADEEMGNTEAAKQEYASALAGLKTAMEKYGSVSFYSPDLSGGAPSGASYRDYCAGLIAILEANELESQGYRKEAIAQIENASARYFKPLSKAQFMDSERLVQYCQARIYQLKQMKQSAIDSFWELSGLYVLDSKKRYNDILNNIPLPTQAPEVNLSPVMQAYAAHVNKKVDVYAGPNDTNAPYAKIAILTVKENTKMSVCARDGDYFVAEMDTYSGKIRFWVPSIRVYRDEGKDVSLPSIECKGRSKMIYKDAEALYGPGEGYRSRGLKIPKGSRVDIYNAEGAYTLVEYKEPTGTQKIRVWIPTDCLNR